MAGRRRRGMDSSPAREGDRVPVGFRRREAVAAWRGGGPSGDGTRPETGGGGGASGERRATGRRHGRARRKGEKEEGDAGKLYRGSKGADMAGKPPDLAGDVGEKREKVGGIQIDSRPFAGARAGREMRGRGRGRGREVRARSGGATWRRRRRGRFRRRLPSWGGRLEEGDDLTGCDTSRPAHDHYSGGSDGDELRRREATPDEEVI
uniref:Epstein-Barr virus-like protein n=1 Tax=Oryza sativa subsp. japonica TaxID=39947 RepID=Q5WA80_ORYSJ|nr:Epstein-Barr virus-like protein [Oryza sativa Japonica Group]